MAVNHLEHAAVGENEDLLARVRSSANVSTRTTVVLSTPWEERPNLTV